MADNLQPFQARNGLQSPSVVGLDKLTFNNELEISSPVSKSLNIVAGFLEFSLANANVINGLFCLKVPVANANVIVTFAVSAKASASTGSNIQVLSLFEENTAVCTLSSISIYKNVAQSEVSVRVKLTTTATGSVPVIGFSFTSKASINLDSVVSQWPNSATSIYLDPRDYLKATPTRVLNNSPVDLDTYRRATVISLDTTTPASTGSRPPTTNGMGTCIVIAGGDGNLVSQMFVTSANAIYIRSTNTSGTWTAWSQINASTEDPYKPALKVTIRNLYQGF